MSSPRPALPHLYSVAEVAEATSQTERYVADQVRAGRWPHRRFARGAVMFSSDDFAAVLALCARPATNEAAVSRMSFAPRSGRRRAS